MINLVITGASGDLGSQLVHKINKEKFNLYFWPDRPKDGTKFVLIHLAARHPIHNIRQQLESNIGFLKTIIDECESDICKFVFISSSSVYGKHLNACINESYQGNGIDSYGMTKLLGEKLLESCTFPVLSLRCPAVLEIRNSNNLLSKLFDKLIKNEDILLHNADKLFNAFVDVALVWDVIYQFILTKKHNNQTFNLAYRPQLTLYEIVTLMAKTLHSKSNICKQDTEMDFYTLDVGSVNREFNIDNINVADVLKAWSQQRLKTLN